MAKRTNKWSAHVNETSDAMDVAEGTFQQSDPKKIAEAVEHDAERSKRRKSSPYRSAMSMLTFYINRAGKNLSAEQRDILERAKEVLRAEFGGNAGAKGTAAKATAKRSATKKPAKPARAAAKKTATKKTAARRKTAAKKR